MNYIAGQWVFMYGKVGINLRQDHLKGMKIKNIIWKTYEHFIYILYIIGNYFYFRFIIAFNLIISS